MLVRIVKTDHAPAEQAAKGKGKAKKAMDEEDDEIPDGRAVLTRVLVAGALRNIVEPGSSVDGRVGIVAITNEVILPLINGLLDVNLGQVSQRVTELVGQIVSSCETNAADTSPRMVPCWARRSRSTTSRLPS